MFKKKMIQKRAQDLIDSLHGVLLPQTEEYLRKFTKMENRECYNIIANIRARLWGHLDELFRYARLHTSYEVPETDIDLELEIHYALANMSDCTNLIFYNLYDEREEYGKYFEFHKSLQPFVIDIIERVELLYHLSGEIIFCLLFLINEGISREDLFNEIIKNYRR